MLQSTLSNTFYSFLHIYRNWRAVQGKVLHICMYASTHFSIFLITVSHYSNHLNNKKKNSLHNLYIQWKYSNSAS